MPHSVKFTISRRELLHSPIRFDVWQDDQKVGTLRISKGGVSWLRRSGQKTYECDWEYFDQLMQRVPR
jgi:hypothetical protein